MGVNVWAEAGRQLWEKAFGCLSMQPAVASCYWAVCMALGEVWKRAGGCVMRAFPLLERQPWRGDEGTLAEVVYPLTWQLRRENILSGLFKKIYMNKAFIK